MNKKEQPQGCETKLCCRATGELSLEVAKELELTDPKLDKALSSLLEKEEEETDEDEDTAE